MSNELIPRDDDGFAVAENSSGFIRGQMIKFDRWQLSPSTRWMSA